MVVVVIVVAGVRRESIERAQLAIHLRVRMAVTACM
jgi:hypothetical protein